jgi:transposase
MINRKHIFELYQLGAGAVLRYIELLDRKVEDATQRVMTSQTHVVGLMSAELARAKHLLQNLSDQLRKLRQINYQLRKRIHELECEITRGSESSVQLDSHNSSLPPAHDLPWMKVKRTKSLRKKSGLQVGGQVGHPGKTLRKVEHPDQVIVHVPQHCVACEASLASAIIVATERRQVFDIVNGTLCVTEHQAQTKQCRQCRASCKAKFSVGVRAPVQYGVSVLSRVVYLHLYQLLPVARTSETMRDLFGCRISVATIQRAARFSSAKLVNTEQRLKAVIRDSAVIGADETGLRVAGSGAYIHVARTEELTHYAFDHRRGKAAMDEIGILPQFTGTLVRDGFSSYKWYERCRHSLCNAHLLRDLVFVEEAYPEQKVWTEPLAKLLLKIKDAVTEAKANDEARLNQQRENELLRRYDKLVKKADRLNPPQPKRKLDRDAPKKKPIQQPTPRSLINRLQRRRDEVLRFMADLSVPFDNNGSERDLRMVKLQQKISGCFRTADGARNFCRVRSYLSTARKQGHSLLCSLERVFNGKPLVLQ